MYNNNYKVGQMKDIYYCYTTTPLFHYSTLMWLGYMSNNLTFRVVKDLYLYHYHALCKPSIV